MKKLVHGFLFDIGHARAASETLGMPFDEYVERLPMHKIVEVHLAGCVHDLDGHLRPNHSKMNVEDYEFLEKLLEKQSTLRVVTLEYGTLGNKNTLEECPVVEYGKINEQAKSELYEQLIRLKEILKK